MYIGFRFNKNGHESFQAWIVFVWPLSYANPFCPCCFPSFSFCLGSDSNLSWQLCRSGHCRPLSVQPLSATLYFMALRLKAISTSTLTPRFHSLNSNSTLSIPLPLPKFCFHFHHLNSTSTPSIPLPLPQFRFHCLNSASTSAFPLLLPQFHLHFGISASTPSIPQLQTSS